MGAFFLLTIGPRPGGGDPVGLASEAALHGDAKTRSACRNSLA
jgi:hypothetical protein